MGKTYEYDDEYWNLPGWNGKYDDDWDSDQHWQEENDIPLDDEEWEDEIDNF